MNNSDQAKHSNSSNGPMPPLKLISWILVISAFTYGGVFGFAKWQTHQTYFKDTQEQVEREFQIQSHFFELFKALGSLAFIVTGYYAWWNLQVAQQNQQIAEKNRRIAEDKQVAERFSNAVEFLGEEY